MPCFVLYVQCLSTVRPERISYFSNLQVTCRADTGGPRPQTRRCAYLHLTFLNFRLCFIQNTWDVVMCTRRYALCRRCALDHAYMGGLQSIAASLPCRVICPCDAHSFLQAYVTMCLSAWYTSCIVHSKHHCGTGLRSGKNSLHVQDTSYITIALRNHTFVSGLRLVPISPCAHGAILWRRCSRRQRQLPSMKPS